MQRAVVLEMLREEKPLRFQELWKICKGKMSKMSLLKSLVALENAKMVIRDPHGRKNVEYRLDPRHPAVRPLLDFLKMRRNDKRENHARVDEILLPLQRLAEPPSQRKLRRPWAKAQTFSYAFLLAYAMVYDTFRETSILMKQPEQPLLRELALDDIMHTRLTLQKSLMHVLKTDPPAVMQAMQDWLSEIHRCTLQMSRAAISSPKR
jgi:DNA-binding HxlR family transcriptional regulator